MLGRGAIALVYRNLRLRYTTLQASHRLSLVSKEKWPYSAQSSSELAHKLLGRGAIALVYRNRRLRYPMLLPTGSALVSNEQGLLRSTQAGVPRCGYLRFYQCYV